MSIGQVAGIGHDQPDLRRPERYWPVRGFRAERTPWRIQRRLEQKGRLRTVIAGWIEGRGLQVRRPQRSVGAEAQAIVQRQLPVHAPTILQIPLQERVAHIRTRPAGGFGVSAEVTQWRRGVRVIGIEGIVDIAAEIEGSVIRAAESFEHAVTLKEDAGLDLVTAPNLGQALLPGEERGGAFLGPADIEGDAGRVGNRASAETHRRDDVVLVVLRVELSQGQADLLPVDDVGIVVIWPGRLLEVVIAEASFESPVWERSCRWRATARRWSRICQSL